MRSPTVRNTLLVFLTMTSGCVDAISFLALGEVFTAAMTGNTVLFGLAVAHAGGLSLIGYAVALLGFVAGAAIASTILIRYQKIPGWSSLVTVSLCVEWLSLLIFAIVVTVSPLVTLTVPRTAFLIALLSLAMGVQSVCARRIGVSGVTTTVITSTLTGLVESVVWRLGPSQHPLPSSNQVKAHNHMMNKISITSITMWISVIIFYGVGAGICGVLVTRYHFQAIWLPVTFVSIVVLTALGAKIFIPVNQEAGISL